MINDPKKLEPIWREVLKLLGSKAPVALPGRSRCPICNRPQLYIFEDFAYSGQWSFCYYCQRGIDLAGLAALSWNVDLTMATSRLRRSGLSTKDIHVDVQRDKLASSFKACNEFWEKISERLPSDQDGAHDLIDKLGWNCRVSPELRDSTAGKLYGIATRSEVELFWPHADFARCEDRVYSREWGETLVVPFRDLPGRICGLLMIGRNCNPETDYAYKPLFPGYSATRSKAAPWVEGGISLHPLSVRISRRWGARFVAMRDVELGIRLQCSHLERNQFPLPIALWYSKRQQYKQYKVETRNGWAELYGKDLIFWMPKPCGITMAQAITQNAQVSLMRPPEGIDWNNYYRYKSPEDIIASVFSLTANWREALPRIVNSLSDKDLEEFLIDIEECGIKLKSLDLPSPTKAIIHNTIGVGDRIKMITHHGMTISDQGGAWYRLFARSKPELIMDASIEITHVIHQPVENRVLYKGYVTYHGERLPFCAPDAQIESRAMSYVKELLLARRKGLITYPKKYDSLALHIAMQFSNPEFVTGLDRVGWSPVDNALIFPSFSIPMGGDPKPHDQTLFLEEAPCQDITPPRGVAAADVDIIQTADETSSGLVWDLLSAFIANLISPGIYSEPPTQCIALHGLGAYQTAKDMSSELGFLCKKMEAWSSTAKDLKKYSVRHDTFLFVDSPPPDDCNDKENAALHKRMSSDLTNLMQPLTKLQFLIKTIESNWLGIESFQPVWMSPGMGEAIKNIMSCYLARVIKKHMDLPDCGNLTLSVRQDLEIFLKNEGALTKPFGGTCILGATPFGKASAFIKLLCHFVLEKIISWEISPKRKIDKAIWSVGPELFVPKILYSKTACKISGFRPNREAITIALTKAGRLISETESYWIIDSNWWAKEFEKRSTLDKKMLKLIG